MRALNVHKLVSDLNLLCENLVGSYNINKGGCCFIAYLIAQHLDKLGLEYQLIVYSDERKDRVGISHEVYSMIKNFQDDESFVTGNNTCYHYAIYLDGGGVINPGRCDHTYYISGLQAKNIWWLYKVGRWNTEYNIHFNRRVRRTINSFFNEYSK